MSTAPVTVIVENQAITLIECYRDLSSTRARGFGA